MTLLIADDEKFVRNGLLSLDWKSVGISRVLEASNGLEAQKLLEAEHVDIVVCDIRMPGMTGLELAEYVHQNRMNTRFIILSGFSDFTYAKEAIRYQVHDYLLKPVVPEELLDTAHSAIERLRLMEYGERIINEYEEKTGSYTITQQIIHSFCKIDLQAYEIVKYIAQNYEKDLSLGILSEQFHLSAVYLSRYIKRETGYSFVDLLTCIRLLYALELLAKGDYRISLISDLTGFRDQRYFSQLFRRILGCKPNEYRKNKHLQKQYGIRELLELKAKRPEAGL